MATLRGRAASPVRPGLVTKEVLAGRTPLHTGETVYEAAITDLHSTYMDLVKRENTVRPKAKRLRGMTYPSFLKLFKFAQLLNLVELVREEPMLFPPPSGSLYSVRKPNGVHVVGSTRRIFKLSSVGAEDEKSWTNLCKAWIEGWPAPQKAELVAPPVVEKPPPIREKPPEELKPLKWVAVPSARQFGFLLRHLENMQAIGIGDAEVIREINRLAMLIGDWLLEIDDALEDARAVDDKAAVERLEGWSRGIVSVMEFMEEDNLKGAIASLRPIIP